MLLFSPFTLSLYNSLNIFDISLLWIGFHFPSVKEKELLLVFVESFLTHPKPYLISRAWPCIIS